MTIRFTYNTNISKNNYKGGARKDGVELIINPFLMTNDTNTNDVTNSTFSNNTPYINPLKNIHKNKYITTKIYNGNHEYVLKNKTINNIDASNKLNFDIINYSDINNVHKNIISSKLNNFKHLTNCVSYNSDKKYIRHLFNFYKKTEKITNIGYNNIKKTWNYNVYLTECKYCKMTDVFDTNIYI